jgi:hypothetical protein
VEPNEKSRQDRKGNRWHFHYWHSSRFVFPSPDAQHRAQRLFFWNDDKSVTGVVLYTAGKTVPYARIKNMIAKLVANENLREQYTKPLAFPVEKHYPEYPFFPEETEAATTGLSSIT